MSYGKEQQKEIETIKERSLILKLSDADVQRIWEKTGEDAITLIRENYMHECSVHSLAEQLNVSESYLFKLFKSKTGYAVLEWMTYYRINKAISLMRERGLRVYEVAERVGYKDVRYFCSLFKKYTGLNPSEIRK